MGRNNAKAGRKVLVLLLLLMLHKTNYGQSNNNLSNVERIEILLTPYKYKPSDTIALTNLSSIIARSRLITVNQFGYINDSLILHETLTQPVRIFYDSTNLEFLFLVVMHKQLYYSKLDDTSYVKEYFSVGCEYLVAYNKTNNSFYKLVGFRRSEFNLFRKDYNQSKRGLFKGNNELFKLIKRGSSEECEYCDKNKLLIY